jgi:hypothetical protein
MKTSKAKTTGRPKKSSKVTKAETPSKVSKTKKVSKETKTVRPRKVTTGRSLPTEDEIRNKAKEIYLQRIERGEYGNAIDDWRKAEELLKGS